jgi:hypothetical protein
MRQTAIARASLDRLERDLATVCELPPAAQAIVRRELDRARREIDVSDMRVGIMPVLRVVRP